MKKIKLLLTSFLSVSTLVLIPLTITSCGLITSPPGTVDPEIGDPDTGGPDTGGPDTGGPDTGTPEDSNLIIRDLPKENFDITKPKMYNTWRLVKYAMTIQNIPLLDGYGNEVSGTKITVEEQIAKYKELVLYVSLIPSSFDDPDPIQNNLLGSARASWQKEVDFNSKWTDATIQTFNDIPKRLLHLQNGNISQLFIDELTKIELGGDALSISLMIPVYTKLQQIERISRMLSSYSKMMINLLEMKSNSNENSKDFFNKQTSLKGDITSFISHFNKYITPMTGQSCLNSDEHLFPSGNYGFHGTFQGGPNDYKRLLNLWNTFILPLAVNLGVDTTLDVHFRNPENINQVFESKFGKVKSKNDLTQIDLDTFWRRFITQGNRDYKWNLNLEI